MKIISLKSVRLELARTLDHPVTITEHDGVARPLRVTDVGPAMRRA